MGYYPGADTGLPRQAGDPRPPGAACGAGKDRYRAPHYPTRENRPMISKFFIERPIFANVIAIVTIIIGTGLFLYPAGGAVPAHRPAYHSGHHPLSRRQRRGGGGDGGDSHRTGGQRGGGLHLYVFHQRQRRQLFPDRHLSTWAPTSIPPWPWCKTREQRPVAVARRRVQPGSRRS